MDIIKSSPQTIIAAFCLSVTLISACKGKQKKETLVDFVLHSDNNITDKQVNDLFDKGIYYVDHSNLLEAKKCFLKANRLYPNSPVILNAVGNSIARTESVENSFAFYEKALAVDSNFIKTYVNYGCTLNIAGKYEEAKQIFYLGLSRPIQYAFDRRTLYLNLADSYYMQRRKSEALRYIDSAKVGLTGGKLYEELNEFELRIRLEK